MKPLCLQGSSHGMKVRDAMLDGRWEGRLGTTLFTGKLEFDGSRESQQGVHKFRFRLPTCFEDAGITIDCAEHFTGVCAPDMEWHQRRQSSQSTGSSSSSGSTWSGTSGSSSVTSVTTGTASTASTDFTDDSNETKTSDGSERSSSTDRTDRTDRTDDQEESTLVVQVHGEELTVTGHHHGRRPYFFAVELILTRLERCWRGDNHFCGAGTCTRDVAHRSVSEASSGSSGSTRSSGSNSSFSSVQSSVTDTTGSSTSSESSGSSGSSGSSRSSESSVKSHRSRRPRCGEHRHSSDCDNNCFDLAL